MATFVVASFLACPPSVAVALAVVLAALLAGVRRLLLLDGAVLGGLRAQYDVHALDVVGAVRLVLVHLGPVEEEDLAFLLHHPMSQSIDHTDHASSPFQFSGVTIVSEMERNSELVTGSWYRS
jgi:hypothetical protein